MKSLLTFTAVMIFGLALAIMNVKQTLDLFETFPTCFPPYFLGTEFERTSAPTMTENGHDDRLITCSAPVSREPQRYSWENP